MRLFNHRSLIAAFDTGTGKTLTAVVASQCLLDNGVVDRVIIVAPKSLRENFLKEMTTYGADRNDSRYEIYTFNTFATKFADNYDKCDNTLFIVDEAHEFRTKITSKSGKRAFAAINCAIRAGRVLLLTATPIFKIGRAHV